MKAKRKNLLLSIIVKRIDSLCRIEYNLGIGNCWECDAMKYQLEARELLNILCAKSVSMAFGGVLHRENLYRRL
jgi:hypothetical protein